MAAANPLEDEITCSICFDIYEEPHVLISCLHTYCLKCIQKLETRGQVQCPDCRTYTRIENIKKDFKTQRLIDIHGTQTTDPVSDHQQLCGLCQNTAHSVTHHCSECEIYLCSKCAHIHKTNKALKHHSLTTLSTDTVLKAKEIVMELETQVENIDEKLENISKSLVKAKKVNKKQIADIRKFTMEGIEDMKRNQLWLEKLVTDANLTLVNQLQQSKNLFEDKKKDFLSKVSYLNDLIQNEDIKTLQETADTVNETVKLDIRKIKAGLQKQNVHFKSPVNVEKGKNWSVKACVDVTIDNKQYDSQQIGPVLETLYSELGSSKLKLTHTTNLDFYPDSLSLIYNQLWCAGSDNVLNTYDKTCQLVDQLKHHHLSVDSVAASDMGHVIVACKGNKGLHLLKSNGKYHSKIGGGSFSSICCYDGEIYALEYKRCEVIVFRRNRNECTEVKRYHLQHNNGHCYDRLFVHKTGIYVSSFSNHSVYTLDVQGKSLHQKDEKGQFSRGQFNHPILCGVDIAGNMLIADCYNHRLQVCDSSGQWYKISLGSDVEYPNGVVVSDGGEMWVISLYQQRLIRYTLST